MKANHLIKQSEVLDNIYKRISEANSHSMFKIFIPHFIYVEESVRLQLIDDGYKVYEGDWDGMVKGALIIEW